MDNSVMFSLTYGLFVVTAKEGDKDNGCITNTAAQVTDTPLRISLTVNKANYTHGMIERTGEFNVSILSEKASFDTFKHFGFQSGRDTMFIADVVAGEKLSDDPSTTYTYYQKNIKPAPAAPKTGKVTWVCQICGYVYEGEELPADFICPLCKHGAIDFKKVIS